MNDLLAYKHYKKGNFFLMKNKKIFKNDLVCGKIINTWKLGQLKWAKLEKP